MHSPSGIIAKTWGRKGIRARATDDYKEAMSSKHKLSIVMNTCMKSRDAHVRLNLSMKGDERGIPPLGMELLANVNWWGKNCFSLIRVDLLVSGLWSRGRSYIQEYLGNTNWF